MLDERSLMAAAVGATFGVATATLNGAALARRGAASVTHLPYVGVGGITFDGTNNIHLAVEHSDDGSTWVACTANDLLVDANVTIAAGGVYRTINAAHATPQVYPVGYRGGRAFSRTRHIFNGTHGTGTLVGSTVVRGGLGAAGL